MSTATIENSMEVPQNINRNTTLYRNSISRYLSKGYETLTQKDTCTCMLTTAPPATGKTWKQHHPSMDERRKCDFMLHIRIEF